MVEIDRDIDSALIMKAREASERWDARRTIREGRTDALQRNAPLEADTPARLAARLNYLIDDVRRSSKGRRSPVNPVLRELVERPMPVTAVQINTEIVNEVVLGAHDFLSVEFLERGVYAARSVGRILIRAGGALQARGTGFLVAPGLMLTNEHVLTSAELAERCALEMDYEQNRFGPAKQPQVFALDPDRFFLNDEKLDYALVAVAPASDLGAALDGYGWLPLNGAQGKIAISDKDYLNIVQHPLGREKEVVIRNNRVLDMRTADEAGAIKLGAFLHYEADTQKGSSGSPVLNDGWEVVALHHSGVPDTDPDGNWLDVDGGIWHQGQQPVERIRWIANEAVRVSSLVAAIAIAPLPDDKRALLTQLLSGQPPPSPGDRPEPRERVAGPSPAATRNPPPTTAVPALPSATIEIPLRITVALGATPAPADITRQRRAALVELARERLAPEDFADREGYARNFLGLSVPLPVVRKKPRFGGPLSVPRPARPSDRTELRYYNHSIIMCAGRRLAYVSACNLDFGAAATAGRDDGRGTWRLDPRLDPPDQLGSRFYDNNDYDKGHLTRRDDVAWGDTPEQAIASNDDTFFYTNAAPQHFLFNRSDKFTGAGLDLWGDLENHISAQGEAQRTRLSIFNGPIFGDRDKRLGDALVPLRYFKIVIWKDKGEKPGAVGFVLDQASLIATLPEEAIDPGRFEIRQRRIADIESELDITFGKIADWDRMPAPGPQEALDGGGVVITSVDQIRIIAPGDP